MNISSKKIVKKGLEIRFWLKVSLSALGFLLAANAACAETKTVKPSVFDVYLVSNKTPGDVLEEFHAFIASPDFDKEYTQFSASHDLKIMKDADIATSLHAMLPPSLQTELQIRSLSGMSNLEKIVKGLAALCTVYCVDRLAGGHGAGALASMGSDTWKCVLTQQGIKGLPSQGWQSLTWPNAKSTGVSLVKVAMPGIPAYLATGSVKDALFFSGLHGATDHFSSSLTTQLGGSNVTRLSVGYSAEAFKESIIAYKYAGGAIPKKVLLTSAKNTVTNETARCASNWVGKDTILGKSAPMLADQLVRKASHSVITPIIEKACLEPRLLERLSLTK